MRWIALGGILEAKERRVQRGWGVLESFQQKMLFELFRLFVCLGFFFEGGGVGTELENHKRTKFRVHE